MDKRYVVAGYAAGSTLLLVLVWWLNRPVLPEFAEVAGVVTLDGRPLDEVEVQFLPDPERGTKGPVASCYTDKDGRYKLRCDKYDRDGAVLGSHRVVFVDITALPIPDGLPGMESLNDPAALEMAARLKEAKAKQRTKSRIPAPYQRGTTTPLRDVEVQRGTNTYDFRLQSKVR